MVIAIWEFVPKYIPAKDWFVLPGKGDMCIYIYLFNIYIYIYMYMDGWNSNG